MRTITPRFDTSSIAVLSILTIDAIVLTIVIVLTILSSAGCMTDGRSLTADELREATATPQEVLAYNFIITENQSHSDWDIVHQECDEVGNCVLFIYEFAGNEGFTWTVYATCDNNTCTARTTPCGN